MSFVSTGEMTRKAQREGYAVPAFNAENLEMAQAIIQAASREGSPVILQTTLPTARYWGMEEAVAVTASLAQEAPVPVALHLDHSNSFDEVMRAARAGYTSLMFDGSAMSYEENLRLTGRVVEAVRPMGLTVEAELGRVGGKEDSAAAPEAALTDPEEARAFAEETGVGLFAPAIGTAHGFYKGEPRLDFALLGEIRGLVSVPLVLHGGSGLPDGMIRHDRGRVGNDGGGPGGHRPQKIPRPGPGGRGTAVRRKNPPVRFKRAGVADRGRDRREGSWNRRESQGNGNPVQI